MVEEVEKLRIKGVCVLVLSSRTDKEIKVRLLRGEPLIVTMANHVLVTLVDLDKIITRLEAEDFGLRKVSNLVGLVKVTGEEGEGQLFLGSVNYILERER